MTESLVERLRRLDKEATGGTWSVTEKPFDEGVITDIEAVDGARMLLARMSVIAKDADAFLLVAMRNALPELLRLVDEIERHRRWLEEERKPPTHSEVSMFVALAALDAPGAQT